MEFSLHISDVDAAGSALTDRPAVGAELGRNTWKETRKELRELTQRLRGAKRQVSEPRKPVQMTFLLKPATNGIFRSFPHKSSHHFLPILLRFGKFCRSRSQFACDCAAWLRSKRDVWPDAQKDVGCMHGPAWCRRSDYPKIKHRRRLRSQSQVDFQSDLPFGLTPEFHPPHDHEHPLVENHGRRICT